MAAPCRTRSKRSSARCAKHIPGDHLGIHAHNDTEQAVANSLAAVRAGVRQIQGTLNGLGERCGNANLCSLIPTLRLKSEFADAFDIGVSQDKTGDLDEGFADAGRHAQPRAESPRALCRRKRVRDQGWNSCLGHAEGSAELRTCVAGGDRQSSQGAGVRSGRPLQRHRRTGARRHSLRQERSEAGSAGRGDEGARGRGLRL